MVKIAKERIYLHAPHACMAAVADVSPAPAPDAFERAIRAAAARHGALSMKVKRSADGEAYFEECAQRIEVTHAALESEYDWFGVVEDERARMFDVEAGELVRFTLLEAEEHTQLVCAMHRLAGDESSLVQLLRDISAALAEPERRLEPLPMEFIDQTALAGSKLSGMPSMMVKMCNKRWAQQGRGFDGEDYRKLFSSAHSGAEPVICCRSLSQRLTERLSDECRAHGVSVTAAVAAAMNVAWREQGEVGVAVSIREDGCERMGDYSTSVTIETDPRKGDLWQEAKTFSATLRRAESDPERRNFLMRFMDAVSPTLTDAVWYQLYGGVRHPMVAQMADMLGCGSRAKGLSIVDVGDARFAEGAYVWSGLWLLPPCMPWSKRTAAAAVCGGELLVTMQFADNEDADENSERFEDAVAFLEEATVSD